MLRGKGGDDGRGMAYQTLCSTLKSFIFVWRTIGSDGRGVMWWKIAPKEGSASIWFQASHYKPPPKAQGASLQARLSSRES